MKKGKAAESIRQFQEIADSACTYHTMGIVHLRDKEGTTFPLAEKFGQKPDEQIIILRESIRIRSSSALYHHSQLEKIATHYDGLFKDLRRKPHDMSFDMWRDILMRESAEFQTFYADDIFFNVVSLFDYIARLIIYALNGNVERRIKWGNVCKIARNSKVCFSWHDNSVIVAKVGEEMDRHEREFLQELANFRADIIHRQAMFPGAKSSFSFQNFDDSHLTVTSPDSLDSWIRKRILKVGQKKEGEQNLPLTVAMEHIIVEAVDRGSQVLHAFRGDVLQKNIGDSIGRNKK